MTLEDGKRNLACLHPIKWRNISFFKLFSWSRPTTLDISNIISERRHQIKVFKIPCEKQGDFTRNCDCRLLINYKGVSHVIRHCKSVLIITWHSIAPVVISTPAIKMLNQIISLFFRQEFRMNDTGY